MFHELSLSDLKILIKELRAHHNIRGYSRMKKEELVAELTARFVLRDGNLYLKQDPAPRQAKPLSAAELKRNIKTYLASITSDELKETTRRELRDGFQDRSGVDMTPHKELFKKLVDEVKKRL